MSNTTDVLTKVNSLKPNPYGQLLLPFLESIELRIRTEIFSEEDPTYTPDALILSAPDDCIYYLYLFSVIDFLNGEYGKYENSSAEFNAALNKLAVSVTEKRSHSNRRIKLW